MHRATLANEDYDRRRRRFTEALRFDSVDNWFVSNLVPAPRRHPAPPTPPRCSSSHSEAD